MAVVIGNFNQPTENKGTVVDMIINLKFGFGPQWNTPNRLLENWARYVGTTPIDFSKKVWVYYLAILGPFFLIFAAFLIFINTI